jgi:flavin-binding protein dodecin
MDACLGASDTGDGMAVIVSERDGARVVRWAEVTMMGPTVQERADPDQDTLDSLVLETLDGGERDVWLASSDTAMAERLAGLAEDRGHRVSRVAASGKKGPSDPFSPFRSMRAKPVASSRGGVTFFCQLDPSVHAPMKVGDVLLMDQEPDGNGGCTVAYVDVRRKLVGLHGMLPYELGEAACEALHRVRTTVDYVSWGRAIRNGEAADVQTLMFEIPPEIEDMLSAAKLPGRRRSGD